ncbi:MAG TPA: GyrI-like domain-containing protein [bacterium]|nr:GyrI-like domain-containing protein [bacterium]
MKNVLSFTISLMVVAMMVGCGGGQKPAPQVQKPAEPVFSAQVMTVDSSMVASIAKMGPYADAGKAVADLAAAVQTQKLTSVDGPFGVYYDNPATVKPESCRYEVCVKVAPGTKAVKLDKKTGFSVKEMPAAMVAVTQYMGPYDQVAPVYQNLYKWIADNKYQPAGPMVEWYLSDPAKTKPESLMARIGAVVTPMPAPTDTTKKVGQQSTQPPAQQQPPAKPTQPTPKPTPTNKTQPKTTTGGK